AVRSRGRWNRSPPSWVDRPFASARTVVCQGRDGACALILPYGRRGPYGRAAPRYPRSSATRPRRHQTGSGPVTGGADAAGLRQTRRRGVLSDVARFHVTAPARFGRQQPDLTAVGQHGLGVAEDVEQVSVPVSEPEQHHVDDVVVVLVDQFVAGQLFDGLAQFLVAVLIPADFLHHLTRLQAESLGQAALALRLTRGRAHVYPSCFNGPA